MDKHKLTRRQFLTSASAGTIAAVASGYGAVGAYAGVSKKASKLAINGGKPIRTKPFHGWPDWRKPDEELVIKALRSGTWSRSRLVSRFEQVYGELMGAKRCLCTTNGTHALLTSLHTLGIGVEDEVIVSPYTFVATIDVIFLQGALPIFVDTDPETFQLNTNQIEERITEHTKAILPVHIYGGVANMDKVNAVAKKYNLKVVEDACQSHLAEWKGKKVGTLGDLGCFSFQTSKNLCCGEGGAIIGDDEDLMNRCYSFHNFGRPYKEKELTLGDYVRLGTKCRMAEYQAAILLGRIRRLEEQTKRREENAKYLTSRIENIPGILPRKNYEATTRDAYHMYAFRYKKERFNNVPRSKFHKALRAEGISVHDGYSPLYRAPFFERTLASRDFKRIFSKQRLDWCRELTNCPDNDRLCKEATLLSHNVLLGTKKDMDDIADAIEKVYNNSKKLT